MINPNDKIDGNIAQQLITNISLTSARRYIQIAKKFFGKEKHQFLLVSEFCDYYGIKLHK